MTTRPMLTSREAYAIASEWGSYMQAGDEGACLYGFHFNDCRPQHEAHRQQCLRYIETFCMKLVLWEFLAARTSRNDRMAHSAIKDWRSLVMLHRFLTATELRPQAQPSRRLLAA